MDNGAIDDHVVIGGVSGRPDEEYTRECQKQNARLHAAIRGATNVPLLAKCFARHGARFGYGTADGIGDLRNPLAVGLELRRVLAVLGEDDASVAARADDLVD